MKDFLVRRGAHCLVMSLLVSVAGCGSDSPTDDGGGDGGSGGPTVTMSVTVSNNFFNPEAIQVSPGATVMWTWAGGGDSHNVTFASSAVAAPSNTQPTGTFQVTMPTAAGMYNYECTIHAGMNGSVTVAVQ